MDFSGTRSRRVSITEPSLVNVIRLVKGVRPGGLVATTAPFQDPARWAAFDWLKLAVEVMTIAAAAIAVKEIKVKRLLLILFSFPIIVDTILLLSSRITVDGSTKHR